MHGDDPRPHQFETLMRTAGVPEQAIAGFSHHLRHYLEGRPATLGRDVISPVDDLPDAAGFSGHAPTGEAALARAVIVKLNGGLGTGMGLDRPKSLIEVRDGLDFLDLIVRQVIALRRATGHRLPLLLMNSFRTDQESLRKLQGHPEITVDGLPLSFLQHRVPKIAVPDGLPVLYPSDPELEWCPPGHGDVYAALGTSGVLESLLERDIEYAFISNSDNLGAVLDTSLLGFMVDSRIEFMMEAADRTAADRKGGHLCRIAGGRLALRESAQCPPDEEAEFQDVERYRYFNTNNIWVNLRALRGLMERHGGVLPLTTIVNPKTVDPRDSGSQPVVQLETAMGSAISLFDDAAAVRVGRHRFSPVKNTNDLLSVRSDAYRLTDDWRIVLDPERRGPPVISLDGGYYKMIDEFEARFPAGPPSLVRCISFTVEGDVTFNAGVSIDGTARIIAGDGPKVIPSGSRLTGEIQL